MRAATFILATILANLVVIAGARADHPADGPLNRAVLFPEPAEMAPQIGFWRAIFADYSRHQVVLHDALHVDKVYKVLDFRHYLDEGMGEGELERLMRLDTDFELERVRATLLRLHALGPHPEALTAEEQRIVDLFADDPASDRFLAAADSKRLHSQRGLRERFAEAVQVSRRYLPEMERIFADEGLPIELTRLPLIESSFDLRAYSKAGAAGIWQFIPATGRRFMRVDALVDERRDPFASTRAAALYLREVHGLLNSWPLAITAYNHGPQGMARAVREVGTTDIASIIRQYDGKAFGFASRNFYAEFLAALEVEQDYRTHFGELPLDAPLRFHEHRLDRPVSIQAAARSAGSGLDALAALNPALSAAIITGRRPIPAGYRLHLPESAAAGFSGGLAGVEPEARVVRVAAATPVPKARSRARVRHAVVTHRVKHGQTLTHIAHAHRVSVASLRNVNRLGKRSVLRPGQRLRIPVAENAT